MDKLADDESHNSGLPSIGIHPRILRPATFPSFDLYVRNDGDSSLTLFRKANEPLYANTWQKLRQGGFDLVHARGEDRDLCFDYVEENLPAILDEDALPAHQAAEWVYGLACRATEALLSDPESFRDYKRVETLVGALVRTIRRHPGAEWHMLDCSPLAYRTHAHCVNVGIMLVSLARRALGLKDESLLNQVAIGGTLHDVGKARIPQEILTKPAGLSRREFAQVKKHPRYGLQIVRPFLQRANIAQCIIGQHHENACGGGYPDGRSGEAIHIFARVTRVVDVFDALTSDRPYGLAMDNYTALNTMVSEMRGQFDVAVLRKFIKHVGTRSKGETPVAVITVAEPDQEEAREQAEAEPPAQELAGATTATVDSPITPLEPAQRPAETPAEAPAPEPAAEEPDVVAEPPVREGLEAIGGLAEQQARDIKLMTDVMEALRDAMAGPLSRTSEAGAAQPPSIQAQAPAGRESDMAFVRSLFPLVWRLDEWRARFAGSPDQSRQAGRLRADVLACLRILRDAIAQILKAHNVELIEDVQTLDPALHQPTEQCPAPADRSAPGRVIRVGFLYRGGPSAQVLEQARVVLYADLRKAG